ncbi:alpha/beta hydrolase [Telmatospirillum sp. J64-1]|uniref:alpha/beta hydrolase n=1 Tax=Telmatospirillum sp. J64-1 TaxID=2502183 RepID=UPI00115EA037|nr:alpha/beta hydrolase [Telmatospirillum sp. J64-1]
MNRLPEIPAELRDLMAEIGPKWAQDTKGHIQLMIDRFSEILAGAPKDSADIRENIPYGTHERQSLDVFLPKTQNRRRPALVFIHGGAFTAGSRRRSAEIYANVLHYFSRFGIAGINAGYRLAPDVRYPEATQDIGRVVQWVKEHAEELAVDPSRIFLMGHSAGGAHVASYAYDKRLHPAEGPGLAGLIVVSGRVRADNRPENPNARRVEAYYGTDPTRYDDVSPVMHAGPDSMPTFIAMAEFENPLIDVHCLELAYRLAAAKGKAPPVHRLTGHNHTSIIAHFNTAEDNLGASIRHFMNENMP